MSFLLFFPVIRRPPVTPYPQRPPRKNRLSSTPSEARTHAHTHNDASHGREHRFLSPTISSLDKALQTTEALPEIVSQHRSLDTDITYRGLRCQFVSKLGCWVGHRLIVCSGTHLPDISPFRTAVTTLKGTNYSELVLNCRKTEMRFLKGLIQVVLRPSIMGNYFWAPGTEFLGRKYAFYSAGRSKTPVDSSRCSP